MKLWNVYREYVFNNKFLFGCTKNDGLPYWRDFLFASMMLYFTPLGLLIYIPSFVMSILSGLILLAIYDTIAVLVVLLIMFNKTLPSRTRKILLLINIYILTIILLIFLGSHGPGMIYLMGVSIFAALFISTKAGYISIAVNFCIYSILILSLLFPSIQNSFGRDYSFGSWLAVGANLLAINIVVVISISMLLEKLGETIIKEKALQAQALVESRNLRLEKNRTEKAEKSLSISEQRFAFAVAGTNDGLWDWPDVSKDEQWWSPKLFELLGYIETEVEPAFSNFLFFIHLDDKLAITKVLEDNFQNNSTLDHELRLKVKSGEYRWFKIRGKVTEEQVNKTKRMSGSIRDISDIKEIEAELLQYQNQLEYMVKTRTNELEEKNLELENYTKLFVGREFRIKELKGKIKELESKLNQ